MKFYYFTYLANDSNEDYDSNIIKKNPLKKYGYTCPDLIKAV